MAQKFNKLGNYRKHVVSSFLTILVLSVLLLIGPASAVSLQIAASSPEVTEGDVVTFSLEVDIDTNERVPFEQFRVGIFDDNNTLVDYCIFSTTGNLLRCDNSTFTVSATIEPGIYGQGYGYGYGYSANFFRGPLGGPSYQDQLTSFGYGYGYGYAAGVTGEIKYDVQWTTPEVNSTTTYTAEFAGFAIQSKSMYFFKGNAAEYKAQSSATVIVSNLVPTDDSTPSSTGGGGGVATGGSNIIPTVANLFNLDQSEIRSASFEGSSESETQTVTVTQEFLAGLDDEPRTALEAFLDENGEVDAEVTVQTRTYEVTLDDGTTQAYTAVDVVVTLEGIEGPVTILAVVPKSVAESASEIIGNFDVLADDPIISFSANGGSSQELNFAFLGEVDANAVEFITTQSTEPQVVPELISEEVSEDTIQEGDSQQAPGLGGFVLANAPTAVGIVLALLVIAALLYFALRRDEEEEKPKKKTSKKKASTKKKTTKKE